MQFLRSIIFSQPITCTGSSLQVVAYIEMWFGGHFEFMQIRALKVGNFGETFHMMFIEVQ